MNISLISGVFSPSILFSLSSLLLLNQSFIFRQQTLCNFMGIWINKIFTKMRKYQNGESYDLVNEARLWDFGLILFSLRGTEWIKSFIASIYLYTYIISAFSKRSLIWHNWRYKKGAMGVWEFAISISIYLSKLLSQQKNNTNVYFSNFPFIHLFISLSLIKKLKLKSIIYIIE